MADQTVQFPSDVTPEQFFEQFLPLGFEANAASLPMAATAQLNLQFNLTGDGGGEWQVAIQDGKLASTKGSGDANVTFTLAVDDWRDAVLGQNGAGMEMLLPQPKAGRPDTSGRVRELKGTIALELAREEKDPFKMEMCFNNVTAPRTVVRMKMQDYIDVQSGKVHGQEAFMQGRIRVEGDMALLMQIAMMTM